MLTQRDRKSSRVTLRLEPALRREIALEAKRKGITEGRAMRTILEDWQREKGNNQVLTLGLDRDGDIKSLLTNLAGLRRDLAPVGSNLNQITFYFNLHGEMQVTELGIVQAELLKYFKSILTLLSNIKDKMNVK